MTINQLATAIAKREGKKSQARIGDIREILKIMATIEAELCDEVPDKPGVLEALSDYTNRVLRTIRTKKENKKKVRK